MHIFLRFELGDKLFYPGEAGPSNLTHLSITNCDLGVLRADVFLGLGKLQTLTLDYCEITDIENSFKHLENLKELSLAYCEGTLCQGIRHLVKKHTAACLTQSGYMLQEGQGGRGGLYRRRKERGGVADFWPV